MSGSAERSERIELTLEEFVRRARGSKGRLESLDRKLRWIEHLMDLAPGPVYGKVGSPSTARGNRMSDLLDRKDEVERQIVGIEEDERILQEFTKGLTERELEVFRRHYLYGESQSDIAFGLFISQQCVSQYVAKIERKWCSLNLIGGNEYVKN